MSGSPRSRRRRRRSSRAGAIGWAGRFLVAAATSVAILYAGLSLTTAVALAQTGERGLLWHVVQACLVNARITGAVFPCLDVDVSKGEEAGFAVVRAPLDTTHIVVVPTVRIEGVEAPRLQEADAANYFNDAWQARHFVEEKAPRGLQRDDIGLALNSRPGRSQDQLHIHVDCVEPDVRDALRKHAAGLPADTWAHLPVALQGNRYWVRRLTSPDLSGVNIFRLVNTGLHVAEENRAKVTIVLAGASFEPGATGFYLLAALALHRRHMEGHGEILLNHSCSGY